MHQSLDYRFPLIIIKFQGSAIYLYGPPRTRVGSIPPGHKLQVCLYENHRRSRKPICNHVDVAEAYSATQDWNTPVLIFSKGFLRDYEHQVVISAGDSLDATESYQGIQFSHAIYTIGQFTPRLAKEDYWGFRKVVMNDNHPSLSYWPDKPICAGLFCLGSTGWKSKTYTTEDKATVSWRELTAGDEPDQDRWGIETTITGGIAALYGIPKVHMRNTEDLGNICVRVDMGHCEIIDLQYAYLSTARTDEPTLLWLNDELDPSRGTRVSVRLVKGLYGKKSVFPFKAIHCHERLWYSSPLLLSVVTLFVVTPLVTIINRTRNIIKKRWRALPNATRARQPPTPLVPHVPFPEPSAPQTLDMHLPRRPNQSDRTVFDRPRNNTDGCEEATHISEFIQTRHSPAPSPSGPEAQNNPGPWPGPMQH